MRVSVLINNYNYGRFLDYCLSSVARQTRAVDEIIVYDDGSTDESAAVLERWRSKATVISQPNFGHAPGFNQANAINQAFSASTGDIICLLDADDAFLPRKSSASLPSSRVRQRRSWFSTRSPRSMQRAGARAFVDLY